MISVFYEDQRSQRNEFGFHRFVCQLVIDRANLSRSVYDVEKTEIEGIPLKGAGNVRKRCVTDLPRLAGRAQRIFAVYDQDKIGRQLKLKGKQCRSTLRDKLREGCEPSKSLEIVLIDSNMESVIETIRDSGVVAFIAENVFAGAIGKNAITRDSVFIQCAVRTTPEQREALLKLLPDVDRLVSKIAECLSPDAESDAASGQ